MLACLLLAIVEQASAMAMGEDLMKFMKSDEKDYPNPVDTPKKNVTVWEDGDNSMKFEYYIRRLYKNDSSGCKEKLQFHGNCYFWGISIEKWKTLKGKDNADGYGKDSFAMCQFGLATDKSTIKDWGAVKMEYVGQTQGDTNKWTCMDGFSDKNAYKMK